MVVDAEEVEEGAEKGGTGEGVEIDLLCFEGDDMVW